MDERRGMVALLGFLLLFVGLISLYQDGGITGKGVIDMNHGTINVQLNEETDTLWVFGDAPTDIFGLPGATDAKLLVRNTSDTSPVMFTYTTTVGDLIDNNNTYFFGVDVSGWPAETYNLQVKFYNGTPLTVVNNLQGFDVSAIFNDFKVDNIETELIALELRVDDLEQNVSDLLQATVENQYNVSQLFDITDGLQNNVTTLFGDITALQSALNDTNNTLNTLILRVDEINDTLVDLQGIVNVMNHATLNMLYLGPDAPLSDVLFVWGEAPVGATSANVTLVNDGGSVVSASSFVIGPVPPNPFVNPNIYFGGIDTSSLDPDKYNVVVRFYNGTELMFGYGVSDLFDNILMLYLEDALFGDERDAFMDDAREAWCVWKEAKGEDFGYLYNQFCDDGDQEDNWAETMAELGYDDMILLTARNLYLDDADKWNNITALWSAIGGSGVWDTIDELYYGFHDIVFTSIVETYHEPNVTVPITYTIRTDETLPTASVKIRSSDSTINQWIRTGEYLDANETHRFTDYVTFTQTGEYNLTLKLREWGSTHESQVFTTVVVDLAEKVPNSTLDMKKPKNWGDELSNPSNGPDNNYTSWHKSGLIRTVALIGANTPPTDQSCDVYYQSNRNPTLGRILLSGLTINNAESKCADDILSALIDEGDEGVFEIEVEQEFVGSYDQTDYMAIGIDDTAPIVHSIVPDTGAHSGKVYVYVDTEDPVSSTALDGTYSGVNKVKVTLTNKDTGVPYTKSAKYNSTSELWWAKFKTGPNNLNMSDGDYDVTANVTDNAGNKVSETVDPIIDNTPPEISNINVPDMCVDKESIITFFVTDAWAGVNSSSITAQLKIAGGTKKNLTLTHYGNGLREAPYTPEATNETPVRLIVKASDYAINPNSETSKTDHNITIEASCPTSGGGGGGGGSGNNPTVGTACEDKPEHWECGSWSTCVNGAQTRSCTKKILENIGKVCYNGVTPQTSRSCTSPTPSGAAIQQPTEVIPEDIVEQLEKPEPQTPEPQSMWDQLSGSFAFWMVMTGLALLVLAFLSSSLQRGADIDRIVAKYKGKSRKPKKK